jgi:hypothetical protein
MAAYGQYVELVETYAVLALERDREQWARDGEWHPTTITVVRRGEHGKWRMTSRRAGA